MSIENTCPEATYLTKPNIAIAVTVSDTVKTAMEARARSEMGIRYGVTVTGGSITRAVA